jgi:hypothetical protein
MPINKDLNVAPYYDDFDISKKYYRVLFKPGYSLQARELTQLQTTLQNQIEQFGDNIFKEGSIVKGCVFTELRNLSYVKVADGITPSLYVDKTGLAEDGSIIEYYYEIENTAGLKAYIVAAADGYQSKAPDLNTFFINYLNTVSSTQQKTFAEGQTLNIKEYRIIKQVTINPLTQEETVTESLQGGEIVKTTTVATFSNPVGLSFGLNVSEGIIFQKGHFLYADDQTIVLTKYMPTVVGQGDFAQPHNISVGFRVNEDIITSQQDTSLLDNANGSENENAPGADRLKLSPILVSIPTPTASNDPSFFTLRRYENGFATQIRDVSQYNVINTEMARRTYEESGDYITRPFKFNTSRKNDVVNVTVGPGTAYIKGYRVSNESTIFLPIDDITSTTTQQDQPISFSYGGYVNVANSHNSTGVVDLEGFQTINLLAGDGTTIIGSAIAKNYTFDTSRITSTNNDDIDSRLYLFGIRMDSDTRAFSDVRYVKLGTGVGTGKLEIDPVVRQPNKSRLVFQIGQDYVKGITDLKLHTRKKAVVSLAGGSDQVTITPLAGETFTSDTLDHILVIGLNNQRLFVNNPTINGLGQLQFVTDQTGGTVTVYYDVRISPTLPRAKQSLDVFVKTTFNSTGPNAKTKYTLGLPDAYKLLSVTAGGVDYTNSFRLVPNQKDDFYDHSYIELLSGRPAPANGTVMTVKFSVFRPDSSGIYNLFTVNSYAGIDPTDIPYFNGKSGNYNLRDCIDLRPHRLPLTGITYSTNEAGASTVSSAVFVGLPTYTTEMFSTSDTYIYPSFETVSSADVEFYLNRTDAVAVDSYGDFFLVKGEESTISRAPVDKDKTTIAEVYIPGFPTYTQEEARKRGKQGYGVRITPIGVQNYTMRDIKRIDDQIERLSYYVTLSALEAETKNLLIRDENGLDRFKNGIVVDPFNDLSIADVNNPKFNASVDFTERSLAPAVQTFPINLKVASASGTQIHKSTLATMAASSSSVPVISQPYATTYRTATSNFYLYSGEGFLSPQYDGSYDTTTNPQTVNLDLTGIAESVIDVVQEFYPLTSSSSRVISTDTDVSTDAQGATIIETSQVIRDTVRNIQSSVITNEIPVGDFVTDIRLNPYIRSREVTIFMSGLRPNTRHYFFFGGVDVNEHVAPGTLPNGVDLAVPGAIKRSGNYGSAVSTNSSGELFAVFFIPEATFFVGDTNLDIVDVDSLDNVASASISRGSLTYRAYNFSIQSTDLTISTRTQEYSIATTSTERTVTDRVVIPPRNDGNDGGGGNDPLAQTFFIKSNMAPKSNCIYVSKIDLYFKRKSTVNGVTVMIREVVNGYPAPQVLPFSKVHLKPSQVNVSENGSVPTTVVFKSPVRLDAEKEYSFVIQPDALDPDYLVFTSKVGGNDLVSNIAVTQDAFDGVLFTSTNDRAWTSYQDEDVKFTLYRYAFNTGQGTITLQTDAPEFLTLNDWSGNFRKGELIYALKSNTISVTITRGSNIVSATDIGTVFQVGDYIYVQNNAGVKDLLRVASVAGNNDSLTTEDVAKFSGTFNARSAVAGKVVYYNRSRPQTIYLENSSARSGRVFAANDNIFGLRSNATGTIGTIDNVELSFIRPSIERITGRGNDIKMAVKAVNPDAPEDTPYTRNIPFNDKTVFNQKGSIVYSKSNDVGEAKGLQLVLTLNNDADTATPVVDVENALVHINRYRINNTSGDNASAVYISKVVTLAEGFDAEDFRLYVTGYRPNDTNIKTYIRIQNSSDPQSIEDNPWIPMSMVEGNGVFCSTTNINDFREYVYEITKTNGSNYGRTADGVVYYTNATGKYVGYKTFQIKIEMTSSNIGVVPRLLDYRGVALE